MGTNSEDQIRAACDGMPPSCDDPPIGYRVVAELRSMAARTRSAADALQKKADEARSFASGLAATADDIERNALSPLVGLRGLTTNFFGPTGMEPDGVEDASLLVKVG